MWSHIYNSFINIKERKEMTCMVRKINRKFITIFLMIMVFSLLSVITTTVKAEAVAPAGHGTANDPYQISSADNLEWFRTNYSSCKTSYFVQTADIDMSGIADFTPIGETATYSGFTGTYDGCWHTISNLNITSASNANYIGLFISIGNGGTVRNIKMTNVNVSINIRVEYVGSIAGQNAGTIENCSVTSGTVSGGPNTQAGGIVGTNGGTINSCFNSASVSVGNFDARIAAAGGIAGSISGGVINNCWNSGSVTGGSTSLADNLVVGGITGMINSANSIYNCYSTGTVTSGGGRNGGIVGIAYSVSNGCASNYFLDTICASGIGYITPSVGSSNAGAAPTSDANLKTTLTFSAWDSTDTWSITNGQYPVLLTAAKTSVASGASAGDGSVTVTWGSAKRAGGYYVYWSTTSGSYNDTDRKLVYGRAATSTAITGLENYTQYYFVVKAIGDGTVLSSASNEVTATPECSITNLVCYPGNGKANFTFTVPTYATSVVLYQSMDGGTTYSVSPTDASLTNASTSATVSGLTNGTTYNFKLIATVSGHEVESNIVTGTPVDALVGPKSYLADLSNIPFITSARTSILVGNDGNRYYAFTAPASGEYTIYNEIASQDALIYIATVKPYGDPGAVNVGNADDIDYDHGIYNFSWTGTLTKDITYYFALYDYNLIEAIDLCILGGGLNPDLGASISAVPALTETNLDTNSLTVTLSGTTFAATLDKTGFTLVNAPAGLTIESVTRDSDTQCTLALAFDSTDFDANQSISLTVAASQVACGSDLTTNTVTVTAINEPLPVITVVSPSVGPTIGGTSITITGTNFTGATAVTIGGTAATVVTVVNATTITATTPAGTAGAADVAVTTPGGTGKGIGLFTYYAAPTVTGISPTAGPTAGGTNVTITGTNFTGTTAVTIGSAAATGVAVVNATTITATTPAGTAGAADVSVTTPGGTGTDTGIYTYVEAPVAATDAASGITSSGATLNGTINANNDSTTVTYEYGLTTGYGSTVTADQSPVTGNGNTQVSKAISGLAVNTIYHYRVKGVNAGGITYGSDVTFTTLQLAATPTGGVTTNIDGTIKKDAEITLYSEAGATIYYATALNGATPAVPDTGSSSVSNGGVIAYPVLTYGDTLKIKAFAEVDGKVGSTVADISFTVQSKTELTLSGIMVNHKEYDGNTDAAADFAGAGLNGIIGTDSVSLAGTPSASFLTAAADNGKSITVGGYSLTGTDAGYYTLNTTLTVTADITKKALTLGAIVITDKKYDGNSTAIISNIPINSGIVGTDVVAVNIPLASAAYTDADIGSDKAVSVSGIQLTGADSANYSVSNTAAAVGNITVKTVSVGSVTIAGKAYDGNTDATITGATLTGKVGAEDVTIDYSGATATFENELVGNGKTVTVAGLALYGADKGHYILDNSSFTTTGNITGLGTVAIPSASIADSTTIKSGTDVTLITVGYESATLYYTVGLAPVDPTSGDTSIASGGTVAIVGNPGEEIILKVYGAKAGYADSEIATFHYNIQPKSVLTITGASASSKDYDGTRTAAVTGGALTGIINVGDDVTLDASAATGQFSDKNIGTNKTVVASGYTLTGDDAMYYELAQPTLLADINVKNITIADIEISYKVYDGTTTADISSVTLNGKVPGDEVYVNIPAATAEFSDASIENGKTVSVTGLELAGTEAGNYQLTSTSASTTGNIVPVGTVAAPIVSPVEDSILSGTSITLTTITDGSTIYYTLNGSTPTTGSSVYLEPIIITGAPGTVVTVKAFATKTGMTNSATSAKQYTIAEPGSFIITAMPDNQEIKLFWDAIPGTVTYYVYNGEDNYLGNGISVADSVYGYTANGLTNGTLYTFTVKAIEGEACITHSAQISAIPRTIPGAPTGVSATAGNGQATVSFAAPAENGGSAVTGYIVTSSPGNITADGASSPVVITGLTNGTSYTFTVKAVNAAGNGPDSYASNAVTPFAPSSGHSHTDNNKTDTTTDTTSTTGVIINGQVQNAGTTTTETVGNQTVTTVKVDDKIIEEKLNTAETGLTVIIPVNSTTDVVVGQLNGQTVKNMEIKEATLEIKTENASYTLPASEINIDDVASKIGEQVVLKDIKINISISTPPADTVKIIQDTANKNSYQVVVKPVVFEITCTSGDKTVEVSRFNGYVERTVAIPDGIDPSKITTGIVLNSDGTFSHVPTTIIVIDGKYYAKINSLTNSIYSVIYNHKTFKDVESHWAKEAIDDMGSRLVINGVNEENYAPDREITRAEFAAIVVKGLGVMRTGTGKDVYGDVRKADWYYDAVYIANEYGIIKGIGNGKFEPNRKITREEAMIIMARAMKIAKMNVQISETEIEKLFTEYKDSDQISSWAKKSVAVCIRNGIIQGSNNTIKAEDNITRAEVAAIVRRLLQKAKLI